MVALIFVIGCCMMLAFWLRQNYQRRQNYVQELARKQRLKDMAAERRRRSQRNWGDRPPQSTRPQKPMPATRSNLPANLWRSPSSPNPQPKEPQETQETQDLALHQQSAPPSPPPSPPSQQIVRSSTEAKLIRLVGRSTALRLVARLQQRFPDRDAQWHWEKAIYDIERDRLGR